MMSGGIRAVKDFFWSRKSLRRRRCRKTTSQRNSKSHRPIVERIERSVPWNVETSDAATSPISADVARLATRDRDETRKSTDGFGGDWGSLPVDILQAIAKELPDTEAHEMRLVNRHWSVAGRTQIKTVVIDTKHFKHPSQLGGYLSQLANGTYCHLRQMKLSSQFRDGYRNLECMTNLTSLDISGCSAATQQLTGVKSLHHLSTLSMGWTHLTDTGSESISDLTALTSLSLEWCYISEVSLKHFDKLTKLTRINLCGMHWVSTDCLQPLAAHNELTFLDLSWIHLSDVAFSPVSALTKLTNLNLAMNPLSCTAITVISGLTQLRKLNLKKTNVGNDGLRGLASLVRLRRLNLSGTAVDDSGLRFLTCLGLLSSLDLSDNYMVGWNGLEHLTPLTALVFLHQLYLQNTQATPSAARAFAHRFRPKKLWIEY